MTKEKNIGFVSADRVVETLLTYFNSNHRPGWQLYTPATLKHMPWSTLYFITVTRQNTIKRVVAKITRYPDQTEAKISLEDDELLLRGRREYASLVTVYDHFEIKSEDGLYGVQPFAYLPEINAIVMEFVDGEPLYSACLKPSQILRPAGLHHAKALLKKSGQWLRWMHKLPVNELPSNYTFSPGDTLHELLEEAAQLRQYGIDVENFSGWNGAIRLFEQIPTVERVWCHCDFHLRNIFVLPDKSILSMDTALERIDTPYFDICKLTVDIKTRKTRILSGGLVPNQRGLQSLTNAFLEGYFGDDPVDWAVYRLYEGRFLLQKWLESLEIMHSFFALLPEMFITLIHKMTIDLVFQRIFKEWLRHCAELDKEE